MVKVRVLFFGKARELVNKSECEIELNSASMTYKQLEETLFEKQFPELLANSKNFILAVNQRYCQESADKEQPLQLNEHSEIAVFPPLSGG